MMEIRNRLLALGLGLWLGLCASLCFDYGLAESWEYTVLGWLPSTGKIGPPEPQVVQASVEGPLSEQATRLDYALFFRTLKDRPPALVLIDLSLHEEDALSSAYDSQLFEQLRGYNKILFGMPLVSGTGKDPAPFAPAQPLIKGTISRLPGYDQALFPEKAFLQLGTVAVNNLPDAEANGRIPLIFSCKGSVFPSLALAGLIAHLGGDWTQCEVSPGRWIRIRNPAQETLAVLPIDSTGAIQLRPSAKTRTKPVELVDAILASEQALNGEAPVVDLEPLRGEILVVGSVGLSSSSDASAHARVLHSLLQRNYLNRASDQATAGLLLALCILAAQAALAPPRRACLAFLALLGLTVFGWAWLVLERQLAFPGGLAAACTALSWSGSLLLFGFLDQPAREVKHADI